MDAENTVQTGARSVTGFLCATEKSFVKGFASALIFAALFALGASIANAQTSVAVDINKELLVWDWNIGTGGAVGSFTMKCGADINTMTTLTPIADPTTRAIPVKSVITGVGSWTCAVTASNQFGESPPSNAVSFFAGTIPVAPVNLRLQSQ